MNPIGSSGSALAGLHRQLDRIEGAAEAVTRLTSQASAAEPATVDLSPAARAAAPDATSPAASGLEGAMVDLRIGKYLAIANLQVLKTQDELAETALSILR